MGFRHYNDCLRFFLIWIISTNIIAQNSNQGKIPVLLDIPSKASIGIAGSDLNLSVKPGSTAEQKITPKSASKVWLNYSSVVEYGSTNSIYVSLNPGNLPAEISIQLTISKDAGGGSGQVGIPNSSIILRTSPQPIVTNIGTCYTGRGVNNGHLLSYSWILDSLYDPELIKIEDLQIESGVIYTIVAN